MRREASVPGWLRRDAAAASPARAVVVAALLGAAWAISYAGGGAASIPPVLFLVPILVAASYLGTVGTIVTAVAAGLLAGPALPLHVEGSIDQDVSAWALRAGLFVGIGLLMATAFARLRRSEEAATARVLRLANLHLIDRDILAAGTLAEIADAALARMRDLVVCDRASLALVEGDGFRIVSADAEHGVGTSPGLRVEVDVPDVAHNEVLDIPEVATSDLPPSVLPPSVRSYVMSIGMHALLIGGIRVDREVVGTLSVLSRRPGAFDAEDVSVVREVAAQLSVAMEQTELRQGMQRRAAELEERIRELHRSEHTRRKLLSRLISAEELERRELAWSLHDDPIQMMTAVGMQVAILRDGVSEPALIDRLDTLSEHVSGTLARLRRLVFEVHPQALESGTLGDAMRGLFEQVLGDGPPRWSVRDDLEVQPPIEMRIVAYRVAREALENIRKHAGAQRVDVVLGPDQDGLCARIEDDGCGFDVASLVDRPGHIGLPSMRERVELAGGTFRVTSEPGSGTIVEYRLPAGESE